LGLIEKGGGVKGEGSPNELGVSSPCKCLGQSRRGALIKWVKTGGGGGGALDLAHEKKGRGKEHGEGAQGADAKKKTA